MVIPVHQTILADPSRDDGHSADGQAGNCFQAAIASILEMPLADVPHFCASEDWWEASHDWLAARGIVRLCWSDVVDGYVPITEDMWPMSLDRWSWPDGLPAPVAVLGVLASGPSPRGNFGHSVVLDPHTGALLHDPHPDGTGITSIRDIECLVQCAAPIPQEQP